MKKKRIISGVLCMLLVVGVTFTAKAASSPDGVAVGGFQASLVGGQTKNYVYTTPTINIMTYAKARFNGYSSYEKQSAVEYGATSITAYAPSGAYYNAFGQHGYLHNGPRIFYSY